jgi:hypothetical protein
MTVQTIGVGTMYKELVEACDNQDVETIFEVKNLKTGKRHGYVKVATLEDVQAPKTVEGINLTEDEALACLLAMKYAHEHLYSQGVPTTLLDSAFAPIERKLKA